MKSEKKDVKTIIFIACACITFYVGLNHLMVVTGAVRYVLSIFSPFIIGAATAFVINVPMSRIEKKLFGRFGKAKKGRLGASLLITLILVIGVLAVVMSIIVPQIYQTMLSVADRLPVAFNSLQVWVDRNMNNFADLQKEFNSVVSWDEIVKKLAVWLQEFAGSMIGGGIEVATGIVGAIINFFIGSIFAIYLLLAKEKLGSQFKQAMYACLGEKRTDRILSVCSLANSTFSGFISGQCLESCIIGVLFFVVMSLLRMPYAMLIAVVIAFTALIPVVGSFIGCIIGVLLILIENPMQALVFLVVFLIIQQVEGNLIYPRVVGGSVGLPSIWVLVAITVGGKLMGVVGMITFIPLCSVGYALFRIYVKDKLRQRGINPAKWSESSADSASCYNEETPLP